MPASCIEPLQAGDLAAVVAIEAQNPACWSFLQLAAELQRSGGWQHVVRLADGRIAGYICGFVVSDEAEILKLAVDQEVRRQGLGEQLLAHALAGLAAQGIGRVFLELRASNRPARRLYEKFGFEQSAVRKGYYQNPTEDALLMKKIVTRGEVLEEHP